MLNYIKRWRIKRMQQNYWDYRDSILCPMCDESHTKVSDFVDDDCQLPKVH